MDKPFSPSTDTPFVPQNYYMQIIITKLTPKRTHPPISTQYSFSVFKASREFETSREQTVPASCSQTLTLQSCKLNFMVHSYNPERPNDFRVVMNRLIDEKHVKEVGEFILHSNNYIDQYNISQNGAFELTMDLCEEFAAEAELYVDKNQHGLFRVIKEIKNPKPQENKENKPNTRLMRQRIIDARKEMDAEAEQEGRPSSKEKKFTRFSPRRDISEEKKKKKELFVEKRRQDEEKKAQEQQLLIKREQEEEREKQKQNKKKEPVFKKEWIIPAAEEIKQQIARQNKLKRKTSKNSQKSEQKIQTEDNSNVKSAPKLQELTPLSSLADRIPVSPKLILPILVIILLAAGYFIFMKPADQSSTHPKSSRPKKAAKADKPAKEGKGKTKGRK